MKKKVLTLLGALAALGLAACDPAAPASSAPASTPASSQPAASSKPASSKPASSKPASSSKPAGPVADATGHIWAADTDVAADAEAGTVAYKKAVTTTPTTDKAVRFKVNESVVTLNEGSTRKDRTPEGYIKVTSDGMGFSFKIKVDKDYSGKLYLFGVMDGWSSNTGASFFNNGTQNTKIEVNGTEVNMDAEKEHTYGDYFADGDPAGDNLSPEGYAPTGNIVLRAGVNEIKYTRVKTLNMLIKDFVFVVEEAKEWSDPTTVPADATAGTVAYKKYVNNFDGSIKIEFNAMDGSLVGTSALKTDGPAGYMKLDKTGEKQISYKFNFDANLDGKFYQHGMMDSYSANKDRTYYSGSDKDSVPNFKFHVNDVNVYVGEMRNVKYKEFFGETEVDIGGLKYSELKDCEIGDCFLKNGENNITFERVNSYNLLVDKFVFIGKAGNAHTAPEATAEWHMDEISHWQEAANDSFKWNRADNVWEADPDHADVPATCVSTGKTYEREKESHLTREKDTPINPNNHASLSTTNSDGKAIHLGGECPDCHEHVEEGIKISVLDFSGSAGDCIDGSVSDGAFKPKKVDITYKIPVAQAGNYALSLGMLYTNGNGKKAMSDRNFSVKINGVAATLTMDGTATPESLGMGMTGDPTDVVLIAPLALEVGEVSISIKNPDFRMMWKGFVTLTPYTAPTPTLGE